MNLTKDATIYTDELIRIRDTSKKHLLVDSRRMVVLYKAKLATGTMSQNKRISETCVIVRTQSDSQCQIDSNPDHV